MRECLHWSSMGNHGWFSDYQGRVGLLGVDRATLLGGIAQADGII